MAGSLHGMHAVNAIQRTRERGAVVKVATDHLDTRTDEGASLWLVGIASERPHRKAYGTQMAKRSAALMPGSARNQDRLVILFGCGHMFDSAFGVPEGFGAQSHATRSGMIEA